MPANFRKFDVKHGISVNGLPFVDENRNVTLNNLTVQGVSTIVDTRTVSSVDPIITLGASGSTHTISSVNVGNPGTFTFGAAAFDDIAVGDSFQYDAPAGAAGGLTDGEVYYVLTKDTDVTSAGYRQITFSATQGGTAIETTTVGAGAQTITLNPLRDLGQDLGLEFNYVDGATNKKGFFGYDDSTNHLTFLLDTTYGGSSTVSDSGTPEFTGTKGGAEFKYLKLEPTNALTSNTPAIDIDQTWDEASTAFEVLVADITSTNSDAASTLLDFKVDTIQRLLARMDGSLAVNSGTYNGVLSVTNDNANPNLNLIDGRATWNDAASVFTGINLIITDTDSAVGSKLVNFYASDDRQFYIDDEGHIVSEVEFTDAATNTALKVNVTDTDSADDSLLIDLQVGDASKFKVDKDGNVTAAGTITVVGPGDFRDSITINAQVDDVDPYAETSRQTSDIVTITASNANATNVFTLDATEFSSAEVLLQVKQGSSIHTTKVLLVHDGTDVFMTEYGTVYDSDILVTFDAALAAGSLVIQATKTAAAVAAAADAVVKTFGVSLAV